MLLLELRRLYNRFRLDLAALEILKALDYKVATLTAQGTFSDRRITKADQQRVLAAIRTMWSDAFRDIYLPLTDAAQ